MFYSSGFLEWDVLKMHSLGLRNSWRISTRFWRANMSRSLSAIQSLMERITKFIDLLLSANSRWMASRSQAAMSARRTGKTTKRLFSFHHRRDSVANENDCTFLDAFICIRRVNSVENSELWVRTMANQRRSPKVSPTTLRTVSHRLTSIRVCH